MLKKRWFLVFLIVLTISLSVAGGWFFFSHVRIDGHYYARSARQLDLRGTGVGQETYEALRRELPDCEIVWELPFQGRFYPLDTQSLRVETLTDEDIVLLDYLKNLTEVDASACRDYPRLSALQQRRPDCTVRYCVDVAGQTLDYDVRALTVPAAELADLERQLPLLSDLQNVRLEGANPDGEMLARLRENNPQIAFSWSVDVGGKNWPGSAASLYNLKLTSPEQLTRAVPLLPELESVDLRGSGLTDEQARALADDYGGIRFTWEMAVCGQTVSTDITELDLSGTSLEDTVELEAAIRYLPALQKVIMCNCGIDSPNMAALNRRYENIRFVWQLRIGGMNVRTDDTWFAPVKFGARVSGNMLEELRYCEDMVCIDIGHMQVSDCAWAAYMPNLTYLIIGDTLIRDISPLAGLKNLKFLEMFKTAIVDYTPLLECPGLEDLNIGFTRGKPEPIFQMTWLKNLWWCQIYGINDAEGHPTWMVIQDKLPNTTIFYTDPDSSTAGGWRHLPNYFAMRDYLGMFYMDG